MIIEVAAPLILDADKNVFMARFALPDTSEALYELPTVPAHDSRTLPGMVADNFYDTYGMKLQIESDGVPPLIFTSQTGLIHACHLLRYRLQSKFRSDPDRYTFVNPLLPNAHKDNRFRQYGTYAEMLRYSIQENQIQV